MPRPGITGYVSRHWYGRQSLLWSFWINLVALRALVFWLQETWAGADGERRGVPSEPLVLALLLVHGALFVWQVVGVLRASEAHARDSGSHASAIGAQLGIVALLWLTLAYALEGYQTTLAPVDEESVLERMDREHAARYALEPHENGRELRLSGDIALGATRRTRAVLDEARGIEGVVLDSGGGNVYEGRGLARLFRERGLSTRIETRCASACAIAFIGGAHRVLDPDARLGLHRYRMDAAHVVIVTDPERAQQRDRELYAEAGVAPWFVERMFDAGAGEMWWPSQDELLRAGVVHEIGR